MKLTKAQQNELVVWEYFIPKTVKWLPKTDKDIEMFFEWSEQGKHKDKQIIGDFRYFEGLREVNDGQEYTCTRCMKKVS